MQSANATAHLLLCVSQKRGEVCAVRDLYASDWFGKARRYVEASGCPWCILSAEYGLFSPYRVIAPYERTLNTIRVAECRSWPERVTQRLAGAAQTCRE